MSRAWTVESVGQGWGKLGMRWGDVGFGIVVEREREGERGGLRRMLSCGLGDWATAKDSLR